MKLSQKQVNVTQLHVKMKQKQVNVKQIEVKMKQIQVRKAVPHIANIFLCPALREKLTVIETIHPFGPHNGSFTRGAPLRMWTSREALFNVARGRRAALGLHELWGAYRLAHFFELGAPCSCH